MPNNHRIDPEQDVRISDLSPSGKQFHDDKKSAESEFKQLKKELDELQTALFAEGKQSLLVVFQAMDCGGKDGTIRDVFSGLNPQGVEVTAFKVPTPEERAHDYLWRIHKAVPAMGMIGIFNRSHYEDVLVVRVDKLVPDSVWKARYNQINEFEKLLHDTGTRILKFYLHISKKEQKERLLDRMQDPSERWKFDVGDLPKRQQWDDYMRAYEDALENCSTDYAPWHVIPANHKWYRNLAVIREIVSTLKKMNPKYPPAPDLKNIVIED